MIAGFYPLLVLLICLFSIVVQPSFLSMVAVSLGLVFYYWGWSSFVRRWMLLSLPLSRARSVSAGLVKMRGRAVLADPAEVPPGFSSAVYNGNIMETTETPWRMLANGVAHEAFHLDDGTGRVLVVPEGARVRGVPTRLVRPFTDSVLMRSIARAFSRLGWPFLFEEIQYPEAGVIREGDELLVVGDAVSVEGTTATWREKVRGTLRAWLRNPASRKEMDLNRNGMLDLIELEAAKEKARELATREAMGERITGPSIVVRRPRGGMFLLSKGDEGGALEEEGRPVVTILLSVVLFALGMMYFPSEHVVRGVVFSVGSAVVITLRLVLWGLFMLRVRRGERD